jgi:uncharacterized protein (TIGR02145 family)
MYKVILLFLMSGSLVFSQSKKDQIEMLNKRVDSLKSIVSDERKINLEKYNTITQLKVSILNLENNIAYLNSNIKQLNSELEKNKSDYEKKEQENFFLKNQIKLKRDSLDLAYKELEKLKPAPKPVVSNTTNTTSSNQVKQTGSYKSVKIGAQTWMAENLNVSSFRNGDPIPEAKTKEEWEKAGKDGKPAWCYYENDQKNGIKYGKLYNWYAVNDTRGLAPAGWHIPTDAEWTTLENQLGDDAGKKMKSTSGWNGYGCRKCDGGSSEFKKICSACKGTQSNSSEPFSGNGTNSSCFSGLPSGYRDYSGPFYFIGKWGSWWSSTEYFFNFEWSSPEDDAPNAWRRGLGNLDGDVYRRNGSKADGFSVRCLRD